MKTWVVVTNRSQADIYEHPGPNKGLERVRSVENDDGRLQDHEIDTDRPGRAVTAPGRGSRAMRREQSASERLAEDFARRVAEEMKTGRIEHEYDQLVLVAEPQMLGLVRSALDAPTSHTVIGSLDKDLAGCRPEEIGERIEHLLAV